MPSRKPKSKRAPVTGFMDLPPEIRCLIYSYMLAAGTAAILRTSRTIHGEAKPYLYKSAILRLDIKNFQPCPDAEWRLIPRTVHFAALDLNLVQNVELNIDRNRLYAYDQQDLGLFGEFLYCSGHIVRKTCCVIIRHMTDSSYTLRRVSLGLCGLGNFENLFVAVRVGRLSSYSPDFGRDRKIVAGEAYKTILDAVPGNLGAAIWQPDKSDGGGYLAFRPRNIKLG